MIEIRDNRLAWVDNTTTTRQPDVCAGGQNPGVAILYWEHCDWFRDHGICYHTPNQDHVGQDEPYTANKTWCHITDRQTDRQGNLYKPTYSGLN